MTEDLPRVVICQGPPWCDLQDSDDATEKMSRCPNCRIEQLDPTTGEWTTIQDMKAN